MTLMTTGVYMPQQARQQKKEQLCISNTRVKLDKWDTDKEAYKKDRGSYEEREPSR